MNVIDDTTDILLGPESFTIPLDLREWQGEAALRDSVVAAVDQWDWSDPQLVSALQKYPGFEPRALFHVATFAYCAGIFASEEIARCCGEEPAFRPIRPQAPPLAAEISTFRKLNRALLKQALATVIAAAVKGQFLEAQSMQALPMGLRRYVVENATERLDLARHFDCGARA